MASSVVAVVVARTGTAGSARWRGAASAVAEGAPESGNSEPLEAHGVLEVLPEGYGFLRTQKANYLPRPDDIWVAPDIIRDRRLEEGVEIRGLARPTGRRGPALYEVLEINSSPPEAWENRRHFADLTATSPEEVVRLETGREPIEPRVVDLVAPIGKGQRCLVVAPPKAGKTTLLQQVAHAVAVNHPDMHLIVLLIDERPEEVTDWRRRVPNGEVIASSSDEMARNHVSVAEIVLERAKRLVESGKDVLILRPRGAAHAVRRPRPPLGREGAVVDRVPVPRHHDQQPPLGEGLDRPVDRG